MREFIEKNQVRAKRMKTVLIVVAVLFFCSYFLIPICMEIAFLPISVFMIALIVCWSVYANKYMQLSKSIKLLQSKGMENIADDIVLDKPTLPRSKIYCGQKAMFSKKPCLILPYEEIAWVYVHKDNMYGITVSKSVVVHTKSGKHYTLSADIDEFQWLLENYIVKNSVNVIIGYGTEQKQKYKTLFPVVKQASKRKQFICGCVLIPLGVALIVTSTVNGAIPGIIISAGLIMAGIVLVMAGRKEKE